MSSRIYTPAAATEATIENPWKHADPWPNPIHDDAFHGPIGDLVRTIEPHTEADPAALLTMALAAFGNMVGPAPHFLAEARKHPARVWPVLVGETAKGRKGSAWSSLRYVLNQVDEKWASGRVASGLASGEGLIWAVRDPIMKTKSSKDGPVQVVEDAGVTDKRLLTMEEEFSSLLKVSGRDSNILSDVLRRSWDDGVLRTLTKNSPAVATGAHITVCGHITKAELSKLLRETESVNGFGNRFLWVAVRRSKLLPEGGALHRENLSGVVRSLQLAVDSARKATAVHRSREARALWHELYPVLSDGRPGLLGAITNRAEAQTMRLALTYALLDGSEKIERRHLKAGLAVWDYCERSARFIFGEAIGDHDADKILEELREVWPEGMTRTELNRLFKGNASAARIGKALEFLRQHELAEVVTSPSQGGRPAESWRASYERNEKCPAGRKRNGLCSFLS